jgi:hypothetical protein
MPQDKNNKKIYNQAYIKFKHALSNIEIILANRD